MRNLFKGIFSVSLVLIMLSSCGERNEVRRVLSYFMETEIVLSPDMEVYDEGGSASTFGTGYRFSGVCRHVRQFCGRERGDTGR